MAFSLRNRPRVQMGIAALAVCLLALALRLDGLGRESLFMDEIAQVGTYGGSFGEILQGAAGHPQPPLDYWIGSLMGHPESDALVRVPAALFGTGSVLLLILLCSRFIPGPWAALPGLLLALSPYSIYYSQHARPYHIAIFFTLATLGALEWALRREKGDRLSLPLLFLCATAFLWSRVFTPMVTVASLILVLGIQMAFSSGRPGPWWTDGRKNRAYAMLTLGGALLAFLPLFRIVLAKGSARGWASTGGLDPFALLAKGVSNFTLVPIFQAYMTQLDPLGAILLPFVLAAPVLAFALPAWRNDPLLFPAAVLFPVAAVVEVLGFGATSNFVLWRPPFPIWVLPSAALSAAAVVSLVARSPLAQKRAGRAALAGFLLLLIVMGAVSTAAFKREIKNDDWRGLCLYLEESFGPRQAIFFGSVVPPYGWEPTFWGFPRYYHGRSPLLAMGDMKEYADKLKGVRLEPVFVIYRFRNYYLTPFSPYPVITAPRSEPDIGTGALAADPALEVKLFNSFAVVRLKEGSGELARDTYDAIERIVRDYPQQASHLGRLHLAAAFVGRSIGATSWTEHHAAARGSLEGFPLFEPLLDLLRQR